MRPCPRPTLAALALALGLASAWGCAPARPLAEPDPSGFAGARPADGLLARPDLQVLVDAQVLRQSGPLVEALGHADPVVRARAAFALGSVQDPAAVSPLLALLTDPEAAVRADAAFALGQSADSTAGVFLVNALRAETDPDVQRELLDALGKTGGRADLRATLALAVRAEAEPARAMAIARFFQRGVTDRAAASWLAERLSSPNPALREAAAYAFVRVPPAAWTGEAERVRRATDALAPGELARVHLARAIGRRGEVSDVARLASMLDAPDWRVRQAAAAGLGSLSAEAEARSALLRALYDPSRLVGHTAATALATAPLTPAETEFVARWVAAHPQSQAVGGALLPALARAGRTAEVEAWLGLQTDPFARSTGLQALGAGRDPGGEALLLASAEDADPRVSAAALSALTARWRALRLEASPVVTRRYYEAFAAALSRRDLASTSAAAPVLADSLFAPLGNGLLLRSVYASLEAPEDIEPMVEIIKAVGRVRDGDEVPFLVGITLGGHPLLRAAARDALNDRLVEGIDVSLTGENVPQTVLMEWDVLARIGPRPLLTLETAYGLVVVELDTEAAPQTVQAIARSAEAGRYDGIPFHRVVPGFVAQGGDYYRRDGYGGPPVSLRSEFTRIRFGTGVAGMASAGKDTEGVQFFFMHAPAPHLDGRYTAFGRIVRGQDILDRIVQGDVVRRVRFARRPG